MGGPLAGGGRAARGRWTFAGYKAGKDEEPQRRWVKDEVWRSIYEFDYDKDMSLFQSAPLASGGAKAGLIQDVASEAPGRLCQSGIDEMSKFILAREGGQKDDTTPLRVLNYQTAIFHGLQSLESAECGAPANSKPWHSAWTHWAPAAYRNLRTC